MRKCLSLTPRGFFDVTGKRASKHGAEKMFASGLDKSGFDAVVLGGRSETRQASEVNMISLLNALCDERDMASFDHDRNRIEFYHIVAESFFTEDVE